ncbi:DUF1819 family protein [Bifidobacterium callitrichidarum]|uniref:DUF1819 domain-containing protein n=1 Tax=Bifidobacterium callitrichidarum TaxID=2052941 RepID=A0A2U2NBH2_9BIFI|nr:DUF1819 family protein [Bifidobacterium callitrichidarum]PWG66472.1 DUF1819 domain-containing protein [Bifidobacterium callitrichidarum]
MPGSYGTETMQDEQRYRLSFTVGGLLAPQGHIIAALFIANDVQEDADDHGSELGERITRIRRQAIDENVLSIRTQAASTRTVSEVAKRLSTLTETELRYLASGDTPASDQQAFMWVAMCRYYALVGEFASEVLRDHYLMGMPTVTREDYDRFILAKAMWHPELEKISTATANKLRSNVFKAMTEGGLIERGSDTLRPSLLSKTVTGILESRPESFLFFPMREH